MLIYILYTQFLTGLFAQQVSNEHESNLFNQQATNINNLHQGARDVHPVDHGTIQPNHPGTNNVNVLRQLPLVSQPINHVNAPLIHQGANVNILGQRLFPVQNQIVQQQQQQQQVRQQQLNNLFLQQQVLNPQTGNSAPATNQVAPAGQTNFPVFQNTGLLGQNILPSIQSPGTRSNQVVSSRTGQTLPEGSPDIIQFIDPITRQAVSNIGNSLDDINSEIKSKLESGLVNIVDLNNVLNLGINMPNDFIPRVLNGINFHNTLHPEIAGPVPANEIMESNIVDTNGNILSTSHNTSENPSTNVLERNQLNPRQTIQQLNTISSENPHTILGSATLPDFPNILPLGNQNSLISNISNGPVFINGVNLNSPVGELQNSFQNNRNPVILNTIGNTGPQTVQQSSLLPQMVQQPPSILQNIQQLPSLPQIAQQPPLLPQTGQQPTLLPQNGQQPFLLQQNSQQPPLLPQTGQQPTLLPHNGQQPFLLQQNSQQPPSMPQIVQQLPSLPPLPQIVQQPSSLPPIVQQPPLLPQNGQQSPSLPQIVQQQPSLPQIVEQPSSLQRSIHQQHPSVPQFVHQPPSLPILTSGTSAANFLPPLPFQGRSNTQMNSPPVIPHLPNFPPITPLINDNKIPQPSTNTSDTNNQSDDRHSINALPSFPNFPSFPTNIPKPNAEDLPGKLDKKESMMLKHHDEIPKSPSFLSTDQRNPFHNLPSFPVHNELQRQEAVSAGQPDIRNGAILNLNPSHKRKEDANLGKMHSKGTQKSNMEIQNTSQRKQLLNPFVQSIVKNQNKHRSSVQQIKGFPRKDQIHNTGNINGLNTDFPNRQTNSDSQHRAMTHITHNQDNGNKNHKNSRIPSKQQKNFKPKLRARPSIAQIGKNGLKRNMNGNTLIKHHQHHSSNQNHQANTRVIERKSNGLKSPNKVSIKHNHKSKSNHVARTLGSSGSNHLNRWPIPSFHHDIEPLVNPSESSDSKHRKLVKTKGLIPKDVIKQIPRMAKPKENLNGRTQYTKSGNQEQKYGETKPLRSYRMQDIKNKQIFKDEKYGKTMPLRQYRSRMRNTSYMNNRQSVDNRNYRKIYRNTQHSHQERTQYHNSHNNSFTNQSRTTHRDNVRNEHSGSYMYDRSLLNRKLYRSKKY